jgi:hypothetical protein
MPIEEVTPLLRANEPIAGNFKARIVCAKMRRKKSNVWLSSSFKNHFQSSEIVQLSFNELTAGVLIRARVKLTIRVPAKFLDVLLKFFGKKWNIASLNRHVYGS